MIAAIAADRTKGQHDELLYATWLGDRLRIDSLPVDIPAEMVDIDEGLLEHEVCITMQIPAQITQNGSDITLENAKATVGGRLKAGDKVYALRHDGGKRFSVIGIYRKAL